MLISQLLVCAVIGALNLDGELPDNDAEYVAIDFEVPEGVVEIEIEHRGLSSQNVLDWGLLDPNGLRGWGGGNEANTIVGENAASQAYLPGPIAAGTWRVIIGKATIRQSPSPYQLRVTLRDAETLTPQPRAAFEPVVLEQGGRWYRGDFHAHSLESGDSQATFDQIAALMRERSLDFVAITDHNTVAQHGLLAAYQQEVDDLLFIRGMEVTTYHGHANVFGISTYPSHLVGFEGHTLAAIVDEVVGQGALVSINHPTMDLGSLCIGCAWTHEDTPWANVQGIEIHSAAYDATVGLFTPRAIEMWDAKLALGHHITALGGSDDHRAGIDLDNNQSPIGSPTTLVWAEELSEAAILQGVRAGRVMVQLRGPDDPTLELTARGAAGAEGRSGDTIPAADLELEITVQGGEGLDAMVYRNGQPSEYLTIDAASWQHAWTFAIEQDSERFRVQLMNGALPVVVTNHVYVDKAAEEGCGCGVGPPSAGGNLWLLLMVLLGLERRLALSASAQRRRHQRIFSQR